MVGAVYFLWLLYNAVQPHVVVSHIAVRCDREAVAIRTSLRGFRSGELAEAFAKAAVERSVCKKTAAAGGWLGKYVLGEERMGKPIDRLMQKGEVGRVLGPIIGPQGWHLFLVHGRFDGPESDDWELSCRFAKMPVNEAIEEMPAGFQWQQHLSKHKKLQ
eukprot:TRINITY_DN13322_c0_g1_i1.p1 TRINITY_DN13322_c0_g1~~TRINITY_DN13322_c0_g1_i1.p1  ORF type:complete len:160 (+),score=14.59 TRINITY_DN13322_c0_g1_i1:299-778(+)